MISKYVEKPKVVQVIQLAHDNMEDVYRFIHGLYSLDFSSKESEEHWKEIKKHYVLYGIPLNLMSPELGVVKLNDYVTKDVTNKCLAYKSEIFYLLYSELL